jgi:hypothetical protein
MPHTLTRNMQPVTLDHFLRGMTWACLHLVVDLPSRTRMGVIGRVVPDWLPYEILEVDQPYSLASVVWIFSLIGQFVWAFNVPYRGTKKFQ